MTPAPNRRRLLQGAVAAGTTALLGTTTEAADRAVTQGRIKQSVVFWCFNSTGDKWSAEKTCQVARDLGCLSVELIDPSHWPTLKKYGLVCAIAGNGMAGPPFVKGWNNPKYHEQLLAAGTKMIDTTADAGFPAVIAFTGFKWRDATDPKSGEIPRDEAAANCVKGLKSLVAHAEKRKVTVCVEHLNTRDASHPMKGHPGYQGDDLDWVAGILRAVGSPRLKLLFDIYHVQVMHGDVIRRLEQNKDLLGHIHTAGNPGRGELDDRQEILYPPILRKLIELKYDGYVGQEFIPTRDPLTGLREAVRLCDV